MMTTKGWQEMRFVKVLSELSDLGFNTPTVFGVVALTKKVALNTPASLRVNEGGSALADAELEVEGQHFAFRIYETVDGNIETAYIVRKAPETTWSESQP